MATNNVEESLHNKMNLYLPTNKITNTNFIISLRNVIINYKIKKEKIIRKDFVTRALIEYSKKIKNNKFEWLKYDEFKNIEKKIIKESINSLDVNDIIGLINSLNNLELDNNTNNKEIANEDMDEINNILIEENNEDDNEEEISYKSINLLIYNDHIPLIINFL